MQPGYSFRGFFELDFASSWQAFLQALGDISISQNFVYADIYGNIGYRMSGVLPIRPAQNGLLPVNGSVADFEWQGYVPQDQMPTLYNPPTHIIATANQQIVPTELPHLRHKLLGSGLPRSTHCRPAHRLVTHDGTGLHQDPK